MAVRDHTWYCWNAAEIRQNTWYGSHCREVVYLVFCPRLVESRAGPVTGKGKGMAGKRVYISCPLEDGALREMVTAALDAWEVAYAFLEPSGLLPDGVLPSSAQEGIRQCEVYLRICTRATISSASMTQELHFYTILETQERSNRKRKQRTLVNLILDAGYRREPFDAVTLFIDTAGKTRAFWLNELARPLGVATAARRLSRRSAIALGVAGGITVISASAAGGLLLRNQRQQQEALFQATESAFGPGDRLGGQVGWSVDVSPNFVSSTFGTNKVTGVATDGTTLYAFAPDTIQSLTPQGHRIWESRAFDNIQTSPQTTIVVPLPYASSRVLVFHVADANNYYLTAADSGSRSLLWKKEVVSDGEAVFSGPVTVVGNTLYCIFPLDNDWSVCAFQLRTGQVQWSSSTGLGQPCPAVTYSSGKLYVGDPYRCTCLEADTGKQVWQQHLRTTVVATVCVSGGLALFGGLDGFFYALDASSGALRWQANLGAPISAQAIVAGNVIYVGDVDGYLWALDAGSGRIYWHIFAGFNESQDAGSPNAVILYPPVVYRNLVAAVAGDTLSAVDLVSGTRRWPYQTQPDNSGTRGMATGPVLMGGRFVVGDAQNHVLAINP
jgi:outer membrane protein assembly factor BamB